VVFDSVEDMTLRVDDPISTSRDDVLVLRNAGQRARRHAGGRYLPIPMKLGAPASRTWCGYRTRG